tara:strand:+ start:997 stop:2115 length:1119 start_codon:yes stop_codon:yes gene_type:complete
MKNFNKLGLFKSKGRLFREPRNKFRTPFQRDRDRIIHSDAFRRLKHKTQVFVNTEGDHYRTRITHSIEVSQIARTIARYIGVNEELSEGLSLAHDLGHTPFGHAGEYALNECMNQFGGFDHNLQTLRIVMFLENKYLKFNGLNLTFETLDGLLKHNGPIFDKNKIDRLIGINNFKKNIDFLKFPSLEAQIAAISDDIAYNNHDIQDGIRAKLFKLNELLEIKFFKNIFNYHLSKSKKKNKDILIYQIIRDSINLMVKDLIFNTLKNIKKNKVKNINDVYTANINLVNFSDKFNEIINEIRFFLRINMYKNKTVQSKNTKGKIIIKKLFNIIDRNPRKFLNKDQLKFDKHRTIADFISGMTDRYAINLYNKIK